MRRLSGVVTGGLEQAGPGPIAAVWRRLLGSWSAVAHELLEGGDDRGCLFEGGGGGDELDAGATVHGVVAHAIGVAGSANGIGKGPGLFGLCRAGVTIGP